MQSRFPVLLALGLSTLITVPLLPAQTLTVPSQPGSTSAPTAQLASGPDSGINVQDEARVVSSLEARRFPAALSGAQAILSANPASPKANKLVGVVLLDEQKSTDALPYFQKALQLAPDDPTVHGLLLQAYAQSGDKIQRDQQRAILRGLHSDGKHPEFAKVPAYLIETIPVGDKVIQATEFYEPFGEYHFYYRFNIFDAKGHILSFIALESDDTDQVFYAQQHPKDAAAGQRRFSLDGYAKTPDGHVSQALYRFFDGEPNYDQLRDLVVKLVQEGKAPTATASTRASK